MFVFVFARKIRAVRDCRQVCQRCQEGVSDLFFNGIFFLSVYVLFHAFFYSYLQEDTLGVRDSRQGCPRCQEGVSDRVKNFEKCEKGKKKKDNRRKRADFVCRNNIRVVKMKKAELQEREEKG